MFGIARTLYTITFSLARPFLGCLQRKRVRLGKEDPARLGERKGIPSHPRPDGNVIWIHAASVGETLSVLQLIDTILKRRPDFSILITTVTVTSANILEERHQDRVYHQYAPLDHRSWVNRFLDHWKPSSVLWVESEFWPNTLCMIHERHIPLVLLNGRISPSSYKRWKNFPWIIRGILSQFNCCLAQSETDARYLKELGGQNVFHVGNLKLAGPSLPFDPDKMTNLIDAMEDRPRWLLSSSHPGEEETALAIHRKLAQQFPDILTVIVPRHPDRGDAIAELCHNTGLLAQQRSNGDILDSRTEVYVADTVGEMGLFYKSCPIVVIGKSLQAPGGGQNPYEPAKVGCVVIFGPHMSNFVDLSKDMLGANAAIQISDTNSLLDQLSLFLHDPDRVSQQIEKAQMYCAQSNTIIDDTLNTINPYLEI